MKHPNESLFYRFLDFLADLNELTPAELEVRGTVAEEFLQEIANTSMTKVYKMPVLLALIDKTCLKARLTYADILPVWKSFFAHGRNWVDLPHIESYQAYQKLKDSWHLAKIKNMPVRFLQSEFLESRDGWAIVLCGAMEQYLANEAVFRHFQDIVEYRAKDYYRRRYLWQAK